MSVRLLIWQIQGFLQWKSWYVWWGYFPFLQLKAGIQRFGAVRRIFGYLLVLYLSLVYIWKQHIIISRWEHKPRTSIVRSEPKWFQGRISAMAGANDANGKLFQFLNQLLNQVIYAIFMFMFMSVRLLIWQIQRFLQWKSWYVWWCSFPFVQLKADIQRFGAVRRRFGYLLVLYLSLVYICKQHIIIARWEHKPRRSIVRSEPKWF